MLNLLLTSVLVRSSVPLADNADLVTSLPGYGSPPSPIYSGFLDATPTKKVRHTSYLPPQPTLFHSHTGDASIQLLTTP